MLSKSLFIFAALAGTLLGCRPRQFHESETREFVRPEVFETQQAMARLPLARTAAGLTDAQMVALRHRSTVGSLLQTEIQFRNLTPGQMDALRNLYANDGKPWGVLEPARLTGDTLSLYDLMPPLVQASVGLVFYQNEENTAQLKLEMQEKGIENYPNTLRTVTNCWGTAWEFLRLVRQPRPQNPAAGSSLGSTALFYIGETMLAAMRDSRHSTLLKTIPSPGKVAFSATSFDHGLGVRPGDALLVITEGDNGVEQLIHAAVAIDEGLYYEKVGVEAHALYRIAYLEDILDQYGEVGGRRVKLEWRRFGGEPLPHPADIFASMRDAEKQGAPAQVTFTKRGISIGYRVFEVAMNFDGKRAQFEQAAFDKGHFFHDATCGQDCVRCRPKLPTDGGTAEFEIPFMGENKDVVALTPRKIDASDRDLGKFPADGILLRRGTDGLWHGEWDGREFHLSYSRRSNESALEVRGIGKGQTGMCTRLF